jgi:hypothetical protein
MKRLLFTLTAALVLIGMSSFKSDDGVAPAALQSFQSSFKSATEVSWTVSNNHYKANFALNGQYVTAYYDLDGKMMGLTRNISSVQLPIALQASLKKDYDGYWISNLFEMANEEGTSYFITLENADTQLTLKASSNEDWYTFKKQRKS